MHNYQNMTTAHEVSVARKPIGIAAKRQYFDICEYRCRAFF